MVEATNHHPAFGPLSQVDAGVLRVGYAEVGPGDGPAAVLLHGWPNDVHSFVEVAPLLAAAGYRVVVPYLRGFGTTRKKPPKPSPTRSSRSTPPNEGTLMPQATTDDAPLTVVAGG